MTGPGDIRVLLQDPRSFTVKIRSPSGAEVLGTGILVSTDGLVLTCAHVLRAGGVDPRQPAALIDVYLPARGGSPSWSGAAKVVWCPEGYDDDVVCLRIQGTVSLPEDRVAVLGTADGSQDHRFRSYGFRRLQRYLGGIADGTILGQVDAPEETLTLTDPVQLRSTQINVGMSGAPVLDAVRNLVVGIVSETWYPDETSKDRDTAWAVDAGVLDFSRLGLRLRSQALPLLASERPVYDRRIARRAVPLPGYRIADAPSAITDWVGREEILQLLDETWNERRILVVGLIGLGGEGKSSLARRWVDTVTSRGHEFAGVFWWSFTERASADEFLAAAAEFLSGGKVSPADLGGAGSGRAAALASIMRKGRYLFVLDGLESMQYERGDGYGSIVSLELHDFLRYAATPGHQSLCLLTSRAPVLDLAAYVTYQHLAVVPLTGPQGRELLRRLGVLGPDASLDRVVADWGGHALTLTLIAAYLVRRYAGDVRQVSTVLAPEAAGLPDSEKVRRILRQYDECLSVEERMLLIRFSVFRTPVDVEALRVVAGVDDQAAWTRIRSTSLSYLVTARIVRSDSAGRFGLHPMIRDFYLQRLAEETEDSRHLHTMAHAYYMSLLAPGTTLDSVLPAIEAVHHACRAGRYDEACDLVYDHLYQGERALITSELNAFESALSVFADFFPDQDLQQEPLVTNADSQSWLLHEVATCLQMLGRLREAAGMFRRAGAEFRKQGEWHDAAISCQNVAELYLSLGALATCHRVIEQAFELAARAGDKEDTLVAETLRGALAHLEGRGDEADQAFQAALRLATDFTPVPALYSSSGLRYAEHLHRSGRTDQAASVHRRNIEICQAAGWRADIGLCHVGLGDIALAAGDVDGARREYDESLRIARDITRRDVLISALIGHSRWSLHAGQTDDALAHVLPALRMAALGGYRLAEADGRVLLAELRAQTGDLEAAWLELTQAEEVSIEIGYHWGQHDAALARDRLRAGRG